MTLPHPPVLVITDRHQARQSLEEVAAQAFEGGCRWLLLRDKDLDAGTRRRVLRHLLASAKPYGAAVLVSADIEAAADCAAAGVHLPAGTDPSEARARLGPAALIGVSTHDPDEAQAAAAAGADYVTLSPIFESESKPGYGPALGLAGLGEVAAWLPIPVLALGGVGPGNARDCIAAGAAGVAVMGAVMRAHDPAAAVAGLIDQAGLD